MKTLAMVCLTIGLWASSASACGWYLMIPPSEAKSAWACGNSLSAQLTKLAFKKFTSSEDDCPYAALRPDNSAPLSQWTDIGAFERLQDCEQAADRAKDAAYAYNAKLPLEKQDSIAEFAACFASDDPRLAR